jgi:cytochrome c553
MWKRWAAAVVLTGNVLVVPASGAAAPAWAVDPADPSANRPASGQSLFDQINTDGVPFPFEALVRKIESAAGCPSGRCMTSVLVPLSRSLQRTAAAPDFFSFPRVIAAMTADGGGHLLAKDRVFLGYQERAGLIEVISYNEAAARFEFQLVRNYLPQGKSETVYASRAVCTACHQNHGPVFSRQQWDETNANPSVAARLASANGRVPDHLYGVAIRRGVDLPNAIDDSTDRANLFAVVHRIWRDACDSACRSQALQAALQYRLSQEQGFEARPAFAALLAQRFAAQWPSGLAIPNPDLPNRDPLASTDEQSVAKQIDVSAAFEALAPRAPLEVWTGDDALLVPRFVAGLAALFAEADVRDLDAELKRRAPGAVRRTYTARCSVNSDRYQCAGEVTLRGTHSMIDRLSLGGKELTRLRLRNGAVTRQGMTARTAGGDAIERIELPRRGKAGVATVTVVEDFAPARTALAKSDWSGASFTRARLRATLGLQPMNACCGPSASAPALDDAGLAAVVPTQATAFIAPCAACHRTAERSPPNFLAGDSHRISASLAQCAPRMFVRLSMWQLPATSRAKVPMPPPRASHGGNVSMQTAPDPSVSALQATVAEWLRTESGQAPDLAAMLARGYENLRPCLSASQ